MALVVSHRSVSLRCLSREAQAAAHKVVGVGVGKTHKLAARIALDGHSLAITGVMVGTSAFVACGRTTAAAEGSPSSSSCCYSALIAAAETTSTAEIAAGSEGATAHGSGGGALEVGGVVHAGTLGGGNGVSRWSFLERGRRIGVGGGGGKLGSMDVLQDVRFGRTSSSDHFLCRHR